MARPLRIFREDKDFDGFIDLLKESMEPRDVAMYLSRKWTGISSATIAETFNLKWYSSVSEAAKRVAGQMKKDKKFRSRIQILEKTLNVCQLKT